MNAMMGSLSDTPAVGAKYSSSRGPRRDDQRAQGVVLGTTRNRSARFVYQVQASSSLYRVSLLASCIAAPLPRLFSGSIVS